MLINQEGTYSVYSGFCVQKHEQVPFASPFRKCGNRFIPERHDGFVIGNGLVSGVFGWKSVNGLPFIASMSFLNSCRTPEALEQVINDELISDRVLNMASSVGEAAFKGHMELIPAQDFVIYKNGHGSFASDFSSCIARRIRKTDIWVTTCETDELSVEITDFAPLVPLLPIIIRSVTVKAKNNFNNGQLYCFLKDTSLQAINGQLEKSANKNVLVVKSPQGTAEIGKLPGYAVSGSWIKVGLPELIEGESVTFPFYFSLGNDSISAAKYIEDIKSAGMESVLTNTVEAWRHEMTFDFRCGNERLEDLIDGIQVLLIAERMQNTGFYAGVCRYTASYIRDNYYGFKGLLSTGHYELVSRHLEDLKQYMGSNTLSNLYLAISKKDTSDLSFWNEKNEVPFYIALLYRDYISYTGDAGIVHDILQSLVEYACEIRIMCGLSMSHGDETYHWTTPDFWINAGSVDNSILTLCGMRFLMDACKGCERQDIAGKLVAIEAEMCGAVTDAWIDKLQCHPSFVFSDGTKDARPMLNTLLIGFFLGFHNKWTSEGVYSLGAAMRHLTMPGSMLMSSTDFPIYTGMNPGLYLAALAETDSPAGESALLAAIDLASSTGTYFEYYDVYEQRRLGETIRAIEGGCTLTGIIEYLFGIRPLKDGIRVKPHLPSWSGEMELKRFKSNDGTYSLKLKDSQLQISVEGTGISKSPEAVICINPLCELEFHHDIDGKYAKTAIVLRPSKEAAPRELEFRLEIDDDSGEADVFPGGFCELFIVYRTANGREINIKQKTDPSGVKIYNFGNKPVFVRGISVASGGYIALVPEGPAVIQACTYDAADALTSRLFTGEAFRISGWVRRGCIPYDAEVELVHDGRTQVVQTHGGHFETMMSGQDLSEDTVSTIVIRTPGASALIDIMIMKRDVLKWKAKVLEGYAPCIVCRPDSKGLASIIAMELSLLMGIHVPLIESENINVALILKPSCENACGGPNDGDLIITGDKDELPEKVNGILEEFRLYWKHVPLITTSEWKIKSPRYPMVLASRYLNNPEGKIHALIRCETDTL
ncbi:MAG: hypothetical protein FIA99_10715, partial [Ruminiclostridium sp.]|nr:hypothetical protein [Ruminiclostridium sp.]